RTDRVQFRPGIVPGETSVGAAKSGPSRQNLTCHSERQYIPSAPTAHNVLGVGGGLHFPNALRQSTYPFELDLRPDRKIDNPANARVDRGCQATFAHRKELSSVCTNCQSQNVPAVTRISPYRRCNRLGPPARKRRGLMVPCSASATIPRRA